jgi:hypothetical protein
LAHTDETTTTWLIGLTCSREVDFPPENTPTTRNNPWQIAPHGLDFVEFETRVIVRAAPGTMTLLQPRYMHGTTRGHRVIQLGVSMSSSQHVSDAFHAGQGLVNREEERGHFHDETVYYGQTSSS